MADETRSYPLRAVETVREQARQGAERAYADALEELERRRRDRARARERVRALRAEEAARRAGQPQRQAGTARAAALLREEAFVRHRRGRLDELLEDLKRATAAERAAAADAERARRALADRAAESEVIERHRERWSRGRERHRERRRQDELDELALRPKPR